MTSATTDQKQTERVEKWLFIGAGLSNMVIAWRLLQSSRPVEICFLDDGMAPLRRWSFHESDLDAAVFRWASQLVDVSWAGSDVLTTKTHITLESRYCSILSKSLVKRLQESPGVAWKSPVRVASVDTTSATDDTGIRYVADVVIDGRGAGELDKVCGYQKFLGWDVRLEKPHGISRPTLMDFQVEQHDGFRFVYVLPLTLDRLLIEDTYYSDTPEVNREVLTRRIENYAQEKNWQIVEKMSSESGSLKIPLFGSELQESSTLRSGLHAGLFHMTTGYSSACAFAFAEWLGQRFDEGENIDIRDGVEYRRQHWHEQNFFRRLNSIWFKAVTPNKRIEVIDHFFSRHPQMVAAFFRGKLSWWQKAQLLIHYPRVPLRQSAVLFFSHQQNIEVVQ